eukprot:gene4474-4901_t
MESEENDELDLNHLLEADLEQMDDDDDVEEEEEEEVRLPSAKPQEEVKEEDGVVEEEEEGYDKMFSLFLQESQLLIPPSLNFPSSIREEEVPVRDEEDTLGETENTSSKIPWIVKLKVVEDLSLPLVEEDEQQQAEEEQEGEEQRKKNNKKEEEEEEELDDEEVQTRRHIIEEKLSLMIDSIEALANLSHRPPPIQPVQPTTATYITVLPSLLEENGDGLTSSSLPLLVEIQDAVSAPSSPTSSSPSSSQLSALPTMLPRLGELVALEKLLQISRQLRENEDDFSIKLLFDAESDRLQRDRKEREERAQRREAVKREARREASALRIQCVLRRQMAKKELQRRKREKEETLAEIERCRREQEEQERIAKMKIQEQREVEMMQWEEEFSKSLQNYVKELLLKQEMEAKLGQENGKEEQKSVLSCEGEETKFSNILSAEQEEQSSLRLLNDVLLIPSSPASLEEFSAAIPHAQRHNIDDIETIEDKLVKSNKFRQVTEGAKEHKAVQQTGWGGVINASAWAAPSLTPANPKTDFHEPDDEIEGKTMMEKQEQQHSDGEAQEDCWDLPSCYTFDSDDDNDDEWDEESVTAETTHLQKAKESTKEDHKREESENVTLTLPFVTVPTICSSQRGQNYEDSRWRKRLYFSTDFVGTQPNANTLPVKESLRVSRNDDYHIYYAWKAWRDHYHVMEDSNAACQLCGNCRPSNSTTENSNSFLFPQLLPPLPVSSAVQMGCSSSGSGGGNKKELEFSVEELKELSELSNRFGAAALQEVERLTLNVNKLSHLSGLTPEAYPNLRFLSLCDNQLSSLQEVGKLPDLEEVRVDANRLVDLLPFHKHPQLEILAANCNLLSSFPMIHCSKLLRLDLYKNQIDDLGPSYPPINNAAICGSVGATLSTINTIKSEQNVGLSTRRWSETASWHLPRLLYLNLGRNALRHLSGNAISSCVHLQTLIVSQNHLQEVPSPLRLPCLTALWLNGNTLRNLKAWRHSVPGGVVDCGHYPIFLPQLQKLYLQDNQIDQICKEDLLMLPMLSELDLSFNQISSMDGLKALAALPMANRYALKQLKVNDNPLTATVQRIIPVQRPSLYAPAFFTARSEAHVFQGRLDEVIENRDWKVFLTLAFPGLKWLCGEEVSRSVSHLISKDICGSSDTEDNDDDDHNNRRDEINGAIKHRIDALRHCLQALKVESDLLQHKGKKRSAGTALSRWQSQLAISHCKRLSALWDEPLDGLDCVSTVANFMEASDILPCQPLPSASTISEGLDLGSADSAQQQENERQSIIRIQSFFRGYFVRKRLHLLLQGVRYEDDEVEAILQGSDELLSLADLGDDDDQQVRGVHHHLRSELLGDDFEPILPPTKSLAYGDHIRMRRSREGMDGEKGQKDGRGEGQTLAWSVPIESLSEKREAAKDEYEELQPLTSARSHASRPASSASSMSAVTEQSGFSFNRESGAGDGGHSIRKTQLQEEWGISDPKVINALMKRKKRMQHFVHAAQEREQNKSATVRYQRFLRQAQPIHGGGGSIEGGGRHPHAKPTAGKRAVPPAPPPAWMANSDMR